jgi:hypothetical protein
MLRRALARVFGFLHEADRRIAARSRLEAEDR